MFVSTLFNHGKMKRNMIIKLYKLLKVNYDLFMYEFLLFMLTKYDIEKVLLIFALRNALGKFFFDGVSDCPKQGIRPHVRGLRPHVRKTGEKGWATLQ